MSKTTPTTSRKSRTSHSANDADAEMMEPGSIASSNNPSSGSIENLNEDSRDSSSSRKAKLPRIDDFFKLVKKDSNKLLSRCLKCPPNSEVRFTYNDLCIFFAFELNFLLN
jgi:hypothetical protein